MLEYYLNKIINGDSLELLKKIPDESVDVTFADPPFNLRKKYNSYQDRLNIQDYLEWCKLWIYEMVRITKPTGSIFVHNIPKWLTFYATYLNQIADFKHWIAWDAPVVNPHVLPHGFPWRASSHCSPLKEQTRRGMQSKGPAPFEVQGITCKPGRVSEADGR